MHKKDIKLNLLSHSEAKVRLLSEYLKRYINIISNDGFTEKINIYDLFCGQGLYEDNKEGSPIVILRQVQDTYKLLVERKTDKIPSIDCQFNDKDKDKIDILRNAIIALSLHNPSSGNLILTSQDYKEEVTRLARTFKKTRNEKHFVFIDPYGYKDIRSEHLKSLMDCGKKCEILLWLPVQHMYRFSENGTPEALLDFIEELTQYKEWVPNDNVWKFVNQLREGFQKSLGEKYFVDHFSIKKDEKTVFCLYFFTSHIRGFEEMLEAKWEIDTENGRGWEFSGNVRSLFYEYRTNALEQKLKAYLATKRCFNNDIYEFTLRQGYLPKHKNEIFESWQTNGLLDVYLSEGVKARKGAFYVKYYKAGDANNNKVYFKLK